MGKKKRSRKTNNNQTTDVKSLVLLDIDGTTRKIEYHNQELNTRFETSIDGEKYKVELLRVGTDNDLRVFEEKWKDSPRAFAIYKEFVKRKRTNQGQQNGYLQPVAAVKEWALVLLDVDGTTENQKLPEAKKRDDVHEVLYVAETEDKLNIYLEYIWEESPRAFAIYKEIAERKSTKSEKKNGYLKVMPKGQEERSDMVNSTTNRTTKLNESIPKTTATTDQVENPPNTIITTDQFESPLNTIKTTQQNESKISQPVKQSMMDYLKAFGSHLQRHKSNYGLIITIVLLFSGCDIKDIIEVIRLFDPRVSRKIYEVLVVLINKTDDGQ